MTKSFAMQKLFMQLNILNNPKKISLMGLVKRW
jgi:hypothetical protein